MRFTELLMLAGLSFCFMGCRKDSKEDDQAIQYAIRQTINYRQQVVESNQIIYASIVSKTEEYETKGSALRWLVVANQVMNLSNVTASFIQVKQQCGKQNDRERIMAQIQLLKDSLTNIPHLISAQNDTHIKEYPFYNNRTKEALMSSASWKDLSLQHQTLISNLILTQTKILENKLLIYCHNQIRIPRGPCVFEMPITGQSSTTLSKGEKFFIDAAIGIIREVPEQKITIAGKSLKQDENGTFKYESFAPKTKGVFFVPVVFEYIDQDGKKLKMSKNIKFTVK